MQYINLLFPHDYIYLPWISGDLLEKIPDASLLIPKLDVKEVHKPRDGDSYVYRI